MHDTYNMLWSDVDDTIRVLCGKIGGLRKPTFLGIINGGVIPAMILAKRFDSQFYVTDVALQITKRGLDLIKRSTDLIFVDDITDSGETLKILGTLCSEINVKFESAVLCHRTTSSIKPTHVGMDIEDDRWVRFPWENPDEKQMRNRDII